MFKIKSELPQPTLLIKILSILVILGGFYYLGFEIFSKFVAESLWFQELGYFPVFWLRLKTKIILWIVVTLGTFLFFWGNLHLTQRLKFPSPPSRNSDDLLPHPPPKNPLFLSYFSPELSSVKLKQKKTENITLSFPWSLILILSLSLLISLILIHYSTITLNHWRLDHEIHSLLFHNPPFFQLDTLVQLWKQLSENQWLLLIAILISIPSLIKPTLYLKLLNVILSLQLGFIASHQWTTLLKFFNPIAFDKTDPLLTKDISFYIFTLPFLDLVIFWIITLFLYALISASLIYLISGNTFIRGNFTEFLPEQKRHLLSLASGLILIIAIRYWYNRYHLLYASEGVIYGAGYTDVTIRLPVYTLLSVIGSVIAVVLLFKTFSKPSQFTNFKLRTIIIFMLLLHIILTGILPKLVQRFIVQPNELAREKPYIEKSIRYTRNAFDLKEIDVEIFDPVGKLTEETLKKNYLTIDNIRLWDQKPILKTNRQLQQIRPYYEFPDAELDRYIFPRISTDNGERKLIKESQQVILSARELDYNSVPEKAKTWVNKHLIYTHGYGFTMSPVNRATPEGLPDYFVKDIGANNNEKQGTLSLKDERVRATIPIGFPRIYYGEITDTEIMTPSKVKEFDYPSGDQNVYNTYDGEGGVSLKTFWRRLIFAQYLKNWPMLFTRNFIPETKILFRRNIRERVQAIAPFLRYDKDPYLVVVDLNPSDQSSQKNNLYWIIDAYTTSHYYPYSDPGEHDFNYIRNSVKVVIDAYHGSVKFYVANPQDPLIQSWQKIFPNLLQPLEKMPAPLRQHIRYPVDFFSVQSERLLTYHIEDTQVFYNREDVWRVPKEIYGSEPKLVSPYYLIMKLPTQKSEEFILLLPFTPASRNNLIAWLAARSDGKNYGKLFLYQFPKQRLIYGPEQIEALINQDPVISEQISLWNRQGSRAIQGNLLVIPIEQSLLYVEPLYLEASQNGLPTLVRVIVSYENKIVMATTLEEALKQLFRGKTTQPRVILRQVE